MERGAERRRGADRVAKVSWRGECGRQSEGGGQAQTERGGGGNGDEEAQGVDGGRLAQMMGTMEFGKKRRGKGEGMWGATDE